MTCDTSGAPGATVTRLHEYLDTEANGGQPQENRVPFESGIGGLQCLLGNPRFSRPANQGHTPGIEEQRPAPVSKACREARLVRMWLEELAELECDTPPARCSRG